MGTNETYSEPLNMSFHSRLIQKKKVAEEKFVSVLKVEESEHRLHTKRRRVSKDLRYVHKHSVEFLHFYLPASKLCIPFAWFYWMSIL